MKILLLAVIIAATVALVQSSSAPLPHNFKNAVGAFSLSFGAAVVDGVDGIEMEFSLPGLGWISIGFGTSMQNTDMVVGWVSDDGSVSIGDYWSLQHGPPATDLSQGGTEDVRLVDGARAGGVTTLRFLRKLNTGDTLDAVLSLAPTAIVYAWSEGAVGNLTYHGPINHNAVTVDLSGREQAVRPLAAPAPLPWSFFNAVGNFSVAWGAAAVDGADGLEVEFSLPGPGWIGLGFGASMQNADLIVGCVLDDGTALISDYWSLQEGPPAADASLGGTQDVRLLGGSRAGGVTTLRFQRRLNTGDRFDAALSLAPTSIVYAWSDGATGDFNYHGAKNHNVVTVDLSGSGSVSPVMMGAL